MSEGMTESGGYAYLVYESGSAEHLPKDPRNVIKNLHKGKITGL